MAMGMLAIATAGAADRVDQVLADKWRFIREDAGLTAATAAWQEITLPHTWNATDILPLPSTGPESPKPTPYRGVGWYSRTLTLDPAWRDRRVFIRFEAASLVAQVHLNGKPLGEHRGGFTAFCFELTPHLQWEGRNELRVRVDNAKVPDVAPLSGDFNVQGGLHRLVHLLVTDQTCISPLDHASAGVYVQHGAIDGTSTTVTVRTKLSVPVGRPAPGITTELLAADGTVVATATAAHPASTDEHSASLSLPKPRLWQGRQDPYLYTCRVTLTGSGDRVEVPFGIRTVAITDAQGFLLNGKPYPIHGVNRHMDVQGKGWALGPEDHDKDLALIASMGATAIRLAHLPQSEYVHHLCDRAGFLAWEELPLVDVTTDSPAFTANAELQLTEMILQLGNHPSLAFWSLYNEIRDDVERNAKLLQHLKTALLKLDQSRLVVGATCVKPGPMHTVPDWNCWNKYPGWYSGGAGDLGKYVSEYAKEIGRRAGVSEYGCGANPAHHQEDETLKPKKTTQVLHPEEYQAYNHERNWASIKDHPRCWGSFIWNMFDFTAADRNEGGLSGLNDKGLVSYDRAIRKDAFFFYKANWNPDPMIHLCGQRFTRREATTVTVKAYANVGPVVLTVNGTAMPEATPDDQHIIRWEKVALQPGENVVTIRASAGALTLEDRAAWTVVPAAEKP